MLGQSTHFPGATMWTGLFQRCCWLSLGGLGAASDEERPGRVVTAKFGAD